MTQPVVMLYVQHLLGIGHLKRALALAHGLRKAGVRVVIASGGMPVPQLDTAGLEFVQLPPARAADAAFSGVQDEFGRPVDQAWWSMRSRALIDICNRTRPDAVIVEMYPFGRRQFRFELLPFLEWVRGSSQSLIMNSVRDILVDKGKPERVRETVDVVRQWFDLVLVHGDPSLVKLDASFPLAAEISDKIRYTGYVTEKAFRSRAIVLDEGPNRGEVLVSAGGGVVGFPLLSAAIAAKPLSRLRDHPWRVITGANLPDAEFAQLAAQAANGQKGDREDEPAIILERFRADFTDLLQRCRLSISQAGYNTVLEVLATGIPAVMVPFAEGNESEQTIRAQLLEQRGLLHLVPPDRLTPQQLAAAVDQAAEALPPRLAIDLDGARHSAEMVLQAIAARQPSPRTVP
ncbi:MAG TPA: glycosyltransferase [Dongiaceae bacterium]